jgi:hypothetical protein
VERRWKCLWPEFRYSSNLLAGTGKKPQKVLVGRK